MKALFLFAGLLGLALVACSPATPATQKLTANEYDYANGVILLRLSPNLAPDQAAEYQRVLGIVKQRWW